MRNWELRIILASLGTEPTEFPHQLFRTQKICTLCKLKLSSSYLHRAVLGENVYFYKGKKGLPYAIRRAVRMWYSEIQKYDYKTHEFSFDLGHFTQLVWKSTTALGLGIAKNVTQKRDYIVCLYSPRGNSVDFPTNVPPLTKPVWMTSTEVESTTASNSKKGIVYVEPK